MQSEGALVKEQGQTFAIVVVNLSVKGPYLRWRRFGVRKVPCQDRGP